MYTRQTAYTSLLLRHISPDSPPVLTHGMLPCSSFTRLLANERTALTDAGWFWYHRVMNIQNSQPKRSYRVSFWLLSLGIMAIGVYSIIILRQTSSGYDATLMMQNTLNAGSVERVELPNVEKELNIPNWELFRDGNTWSYVSRTSPLPDAYETPDLIETSLAHGDSDKPMKVQKRIEAQLRALFDAAEQDGNELMLSSAFRSIAEQQKLYDAFVQERGVEMAKQYVLAPGASEHHTGLSVDFSTASSACESDSDKCSLSVADAEWLDENAARFGFIQRYPEGKQPITGIAFEPWHFRYVGVPMAQAVSTSGLTYDEVVRQIAPGYAKSNQ